MSEYHLHSLIIACDFRVDDVERTRKFLKKHRDDFAPSGRIASFSTGTPDQFVTFSGRPRYSNGPTYPGTEDIPPIFDVVSGRRPRTFKTVDEFELTG
jgi:hypothetical protein